MNRSRRGVLALGSSIGVSSLLLFFGDPPGFNFTAVPSWSLPLTFSIASLAFIAAIGFGGRGSGWRGLATLLYLMQGPTLALGGVFASEPPWVEGAVLLASLGSAWAFFRSVSAEPLPESASAFPTGAWAWPAD